MQCCKFNLKDSKKNKIKKSQVVQGMQSKKNKQVRAPGGHFFCIIICIAICPLFITTEMRNDPSE